MSNSDQQTAVERLDTRQQAEALRAQGFSVSQIAEHLKIPRSTAHSWVRHVELESPELEPEPISVYPLTSFDYVVSALPQGPESSNSCGFDPSGNLRTVNAWTYGPGDEEIPHRSGVCSKHGEPIHQMYLRQLDMWHTAVECQKCKEGK